MVGEDDKPPGLRNGKQTERLSIHEKEETLVLWRSQRDGGMSGQGGCSLKWALPGD